MYRGQPVAVKEMKSVGVPAASAMKVLGKEVAVLQRCNSEHMVGFLGVCMASEGSLKLVFELMEGGTLFRKLHDNAPAEAARWRWVGRFVFSSGVQPECIDHCVHFWLPRGKHVAVDVAAALVYLHEQAHIIHGARG